MKEHGLRRYDERSFFTWALKRKVRMSKISDALDRSRREQERPPLGVETPGDVPTVLGAARSELPESDVEAYQSLGTELYMSLSELPSRTVMFASAETGAGTSTVAREFATVMALNRETRTLLVDANLRRPTQHEALSVPRSPGISDYILGEAELSDCLRPTKIANLSILPAGRPAVAPPRVFSDSRMSSALGEFRNAYDLVVVDSAPLAPFSEGVQLSRVVDGVVMVIHSASTKQTTARRVLAMLDDAGANVLGSVLNGRKLYIPQFIYERL